MQNSFPRIVPSSKNALTIALKSPLLSKWPQNLQVLHLDFQLIYWQITIGSRSTQLMRVFHKDSFLHLFLLNINDLIHSTSNPDDSTFHAIFQLLMPPSSIELNINHMILCTLETVMNCEGTNLVQFDAVKTQTCSLCNKMVIPWSLMTLS